MTTRTKIILLGGGGLLGNQLKSELSKDPTIQLIVITGRADYDLGCIHSLERLTELVEDSVVINCAGVTSKQECEDSPEYCRQVNCISPGYLARFCKYMIHLSTDTVFNSLHLFNDENSTVDPDSLYSKIKLESEKLITNANKSSLVIRSRFLGLSKSDGFLNFVCRHLQAGSLIPGYNNEIFNPVHVSSLAKYISLIHHIRPIGIRHFGGDYAISKFGFICELVTLLGFNPSDTVVPKTVRPADSSRSTALSSLFPIQSELERTLNGTLRLCAQQINLSLSADRTNEPR